MAHTPGSLRARLKDSADQAWRLYCALELVVPYREATRNDQVRTSRQRLVSSTIPWHTTAAGLVLELDAEVRRLEVHLAEMVTGTWGRRRGGSAANTRYALQALPKLVETVDDQHALSVLNVLDRWNRRADTVFNPEKGLHRIPREPGEKELRCPYCDFLTMRWNPATGIVVCINPDCVTDEKIRPRWIAEFVITDGILQFSWEMLGEAA